MKLKEILAILDAKPLVCPDENLDIRMGCGCDLMSDVLAFIKPQTLLLTGLTTAQAIYTAEMTDIEAICFVRGKVPSGDVINLAKTKEIALLTTQLPMFESCGRLFRAGIIGCSEADRVSGKDRKVSKTRK
ncbi:MAG: hypothetical protein QME66_00415 [Candidatus Eisenbacteria bacterium]|nr:hypothetical protein [Candidatus Eisenbacteria bacterium]